MILASLYSLLLIGLIGCNGQNDGGNGDGTAAPEAVNYGPGTMQREGDIRFFTERNADYGVFPEDFNWNDGVNQRIARNDGQDGNRQRNTQGNTQQNGQENQQNNQQVNEQAVGDFQKQVVQLTNERRKNNGLKPLKIDNQVMKVAQKKSEDMAQNGYFSHTSPTYGSPFEMMKQFGVDYRTAAENIAAGQDTPEQVVEGWMNSPGHRKNILNGELTHIGVGYAEEGGARGTYWTQMFIGK
ncbi:CAP domain-containing protein [Thalassobacillus pellis]|uniref:CAP domain-containing protein n=1 Tax=Thalassobacillus pellis TaxID=748008 RepID=UPI00195FA7E4|nr:CAP domain-containing protein [Thalassobacillus pellis]